MECSTERASVQEETDRVSAELETARAAAEQAAITSQESSAELKASLEAEFAQVHIDDSSPGLQGPPRLRSEVICSV